MEIFVYSVAGGALLFGAFILGIRMGFGYAGKVLGISDNRNRIKIDHKPVKLTELAQSFVKRELEKDGEAKALPQHIQDEVANLMREHI